MRQVMARIAVTVFMLLPLHVLSADFSGKTIEVIVPAAIGGGTDVWARFYAPLLSERLPGKPTIVIKNLPGASNTTGTNYFQSRAKPDGLMILAAPTATLMPYLLEDPRVKYEYRDWTAVIASPLGMAVYAQPDLGVSGAKEMRKIIGPEHKYASQGATTTDMLFFLAADIMGLKLKPVFGMTGRGPTRLAFERREVAIDNQTTDAYRVSVLPLVKARKAVPLFTYGVLDSQGNLVRDPAFPELPHFAEAYQFAHGKPPGGQQYDTWKAMVGGLAALLVLSKGTPDDIVNAYSKAAQDAVSTPGFDERALNVLGPYKQMTGPEAHAHMNRIISINKDARAAVRKWLAEKYDVKF